MSNLLEQASLVMIPSGYKEDIVYSEIPLDGSGDLQFTRSSNGTRVNSAGLVEVCPWNLAEQSNAFSTSPWSRNLTTLTSGQTDPNGTANAWKVEFAAGSAYLYQPGILVTGVVTMSAYLRADITTTIGFNDGSAYPNSITIGTTWQRYEFSFNVTGANTAIQFDNYFGVSPANLAKTFYIYGAQLNIGATAKPYFPTTDRLNVPRLTYQNGGGGCPSLLLEKQSTNLCTYSEQLDNAAWTQNSTSVTANATTSPDGTQNADTIASISASPRVVSPTAVFTSTTNVSIFVKYVSQQWVMLMSGGAVNDYANFDIQNGVIGSVGSTSSNAQIQSFGNGWYRISVTFSGYSGNTNLYFGFIASGTSAWNTFDPNFNKSLYAWGCQIENSSYPTSYIPTTSSSATRVADACSKTGISSLIGQTEGVLFADFVYLGETQSEVIDISDGTEDNRVMCYITYGGVFQVYVTTGGSTDGFIGTSYPPSVGSRYKIAVGYKSNDIAFYVNGASQGTDTSATIPATSKLTISNGGASNYRLASQFNQAILFSTRLTNAELASLTTI